MFDNDAPAATSTNKTSPIEGFELGKTTVLDLLNKELSAGRPQVEFPKEIYTEITTLKIARGKKDPEKSGTIGYIVHADGVLEELDDKTKLSELPWAQLRDCAIVVGYLSNRPTAYRVYSGEKLADMFGVSDDKL